MRQLHLLRLLAICLFACISYPAAADDRQYKVEAAFLYSFFNYITWPGYTSPQALLDPVICVYNGDPILPYLQYISGKMAAERTLKIRTVTDRKQTEGCHLLFMRHRLSFPPPDTMLTVFKPDDPLDRGGMIELAQEEDRISIKIDKPQLENSGFQVSSRLLDLAQSGR